MIATRRARIGAPVKGARLLMRSKTFRRAYVAIFAILCCVFLSKLGMETLGGDVSTAEVAKSRALLSSGGEVLPGFSGACPDLAKWEDDSKAILHVIFVIYLFLGIAIICDEQFTSSLECICDPRTGLGLSPDVAGATFMAAGSSAPELASSFIGTFVSQSDVGLGTIIGSAVFNILIIIGSTAIVVGEPMQLDFKPLVRDNMFYIGSVILLICFVAADNKIDWYEALILLLYYAGYIVFMAFNQTVMRKVTKMLGQKPEAAQQRRPSFSTGYWAEKDGKERRSSGGAKPPDMGDTAAKYATDDAAQPAAASESASGAGSGTGNEVELPGTPSVDAAAAAPPTAVSTETAKDLPSPAKDVEAGSADADAKDGEEEEEEETLADKACSVLSWPYEIMFNWTMPDCKYEEPSDEDAEDEIKNLQSELTSADANRKVEIENEIASLEKQISIRGAIEKAVEAEEDAKVKELQTELFALYEPLTTGQRYYLFTFFVSLLWITILSYIMVTLMEKIGCAWGISSFIMGITFLAMGTSVPDALGSIAVAKEGEGDMAVSNAIGSNVFDICMGLGLPWLIATVYDGEGRVITASTESIVASTCILIAVVVVLFTSLVMSKHPETGDRFCLYPGVGKVLFTSYFLFVVFQITWTASGLPE